MENLKLKKHHKLVIAADGSAASGKTTGAKRISKKYGLNFLSSGLLYRFASHQILKYKPKNKISFLRRTFKKLNLNSLKKHLSQNIYIRKLNPFKSSKSLILNDSKTSYVFEPLPRRLKQLLHRSRKKIST